MKRAVLILFCLLPSALNAELVATPNFTPPPKPAKPKAVAVSSGPVAVNGPVIVNGGAVRIIQAGGGIQIVGQQQFAGNGAALVPATPGSLVLHWKNGENLPGEIAAASAAGVTWKTPLFDDPLQIVWPVLDRIDRPLASVAPTDPFGIALRNGSFIYGDLVSIDADSISIHSARHGDAVLKRSEVLSVRRLRHGSLLFAGPTGDVGWQPMMNQQDGSVFRSQAAPGATPPLTTGPDGALLIRSWNRSALLDLTLPDLVDVEFRLHSSKRPEFSVAFGANLREALRVETWDDELVLVVNDQFKAIRKIENDEREVALRVCLDKKARKCSIFTPAGELIATWQVPEDASGSASASASPAQRIMMMGGLNMVVGGQLVRQAVLPNFSGSQPGLLLQNRGLDLSLDFLRVRAWDGKAPEPIDPKQAHVELADGRIVAGEIAAGAPGFIKVQAPGQSASADVALGDVDALVFSTDPPQPAGPEATLLFADGTILLGHIDSVAGGRAAVATSFTKEPLTSQLDSLRQLLVRTPASEGTAPEPPLADQDKIVIGETTLHGKLGSAGDDELRWLPVGGISASRPAKFLASEITRALPADAALPGEPALFYLSSGDVLPGSLRSLDRSGAEFESDLMAARKLPVGELDAVQFGAPTRMKVQGFGDAGWQIVKGDAKSVRRENDTLQMDPGTALAYPSLMQCSEISFKYASTGLSGCRLRLFCAGTDGTHAMNLLLGNAGNQFVAGLESSEGQFENQNQVMIKPGEPVTVRLKIGESRVELFVNDMPLQQFPVDPSKCAGSGLIIEPASLWGNNTFPISFSAFSANSVPGRTWLPELSDDIRNQVLTVPRFQKDDPPRHLLLAANGDVLRGEIEAATATTFGFRCGLENLDVPRDRVKAVIWLKQPDKNAPAAPEEKPAPSLLDHMIQPRFGFSGINLRSLIGVLQSQDSELKFKLPDREDPRTDTLIQIGSQTVGDALDLICSRFGLHYRLDSDGTIILEMEPPPVTDGFTRKNYWLKPDAIPPTAAVQDLLVAKGVTFPAGASVQWQPEAHLLSMTNTAENQAKLVPLLDSDFGGNLGSPTHWLLLTSGARLTLAVDQFGKDFITGHHPDYGPCKVPMAQVYLIRTSPPEPTNTIKALENWRLVDAPEPVLPETGGESSPLLGKDAPTFKLPLLEGENFDLDAEKGRVVVLDFWASWCAPCVQSLPGLIEALSSFPADRVKLIGVNQGESPEQVKHFLEARSLKFTVAMDADQSVAQKYGVDAIPHTVIVGPDGKVAWVETGYNPDGETEASDTVKRLLALPAPASTPAKGSAP